MDFFLEDGLLLDVGEEEELVTSSLLDNSSMDFLLAEDQAQVETCLVGDDRLTLPSVVCFPDMLKEMLQPELLNQTLDSFDIKRLCQFLPEFPDNNEEEKDETLRRLFAGENFHFGNPVELFGQKLESGWYDPDIVRTRQLYDQAREAIALKERQNYYHKLARDVIVSRHKLLQSAYQTPPGHPLRVLRTKGDVLQTSELTLEERARKRYHDELRNLNDSESVSGDEDPPLSKKQKRRLDFLKNTLSSEHRPIRSTLSHRLYNQPVSRDDTEPLGSTRNPNETRMDLLSRVTSQKNPYDINEDSYRVMLSKHRQLRREGRSLPELNVSKTKLEDIAARLHATVAHKRLSLKLPEKMVRKQKDALDGNSSLGEEEMEAESAKKKIPKAKKTSQVKQASPKKSKVEPLDVPPVAANEVPVKIGAVPEPVPKPAPSLTQDTHACFFTLLQDIFLNNEGRISLKQLEEALVSWNSSPITPLNEWYSTVFAVQQRFDGWIPMLQSALDFLIQHNLVEYDVGEASFVWSPVNESDVILTELSALWIQQQQQPSPQAEQQLELSQDAATSLDATDPFLVTNSQDSSLNLTAGMDVTDEAVENSAFLDSADVIHPPRCVTSWVVRPSTAEERAYYQEQERQRYSHPHKAFTFRQHGYESIVGPVKGVYGQASGSAQASTKARGHTLMVPDRPACVTLLSLVRDAAARLPNGEGTRAEICELLKDSQYLASGADASLNSVVSGALDRLHYETDPCVKYDATRKVWIYLHRNRTEAEFEQIHKQQQGMPSRVKKPRSDQRKVVSSAKAAKQAAAAVESISVAPSESQQPAAAAAPSNTTAVVVTNESQPAKSVKLSAPVVCSPRSPANAAAAATSGATTSAPAAATIQTFQITTSTGVQTIRVAAPSNLPAALLARTLQLSAQQPGGLQGVVQKAGSSVTSANVKQVVLTPPSVKAAPISLISTPRPVPSAAGVGATGAATISAAAPGTSLIRLSTSSAASVSPVRAAAATARLQPGNVTTVRLAGRQAVASGSGAMQTLLIRPTAPSAGTTTVSAVQTTSSTPRLVVVNNKMISLGSTAQTRVLRPVLATGPPKAAAVTATASAARPVMARLVTAPAQQQQQPQQQVISLENFISLATQQQKTSTKTGVVQLPLSALSGLSVTASSNLGGSTPGATVLLQGVKGAQSILLPPGLQPGSAINIRNVRVADVSPASAVAQARQTLVTKLITTQQQQQTPPPANNSS